MRDFELAFKAVDDPSRTRILKLLERGGLYVSRPSGQINPRAIQLMREKDIDLTVQLSKGLDDLPTVKWDYIVTMGLDWDLPDPKHLDDAGFREVRDRIEQSMRELVEQAATAIEPTKEPER